MIILAIDTSCDDTSAAVLADDAILSNIVSSQINFHTEWGGVVPSLAKRLHKEKIDIVIQKALQVAQKAYTDIDVFAVTIGPGLAIALEVGIEKAKELAGMYHKPLVPVNHMEGHIYSAFAKNRKKKGQITAVDFPYLCLLVSGNHSELVLMHDYCSFQKIGETLDDAAGEAFDKVARMLGLGYPGGSLLATFAKKGEETKYPLPIPMKNSHDLNFSYSGLKTAVSKVVRELEEGNNLSKQAIYDISASFQRVAVEELLIKTIHALEQYSVHGIILGGGVSANTYLRKKLRAIAKKNHLPFYMPLNKKLCGDNAAMIGVCAYYEFRKSPDAYWEYLNLDRDPGLSL